jgi:hydroxyethylthiazole kinase-like uncharacterized protein yjeF
MIHALTASQIRIAEERAVAEGVATLAELMERAGRAVAAETAERAPEGSLAVLAGGGNNGGDGWVAARELRSAGREVHVFSAVPPDALSGIAAAAAQQAIAAGVEWEDAGSAGPAPGKLVRFAAIVDALLGIGLSGPVRPELASWVETVNAIGAFVLSVDVPSGVDADTGRVPGAAVEADATVTFSAPKVGLLQHPGAGYAGEIVLADVGIPPSFLMPDGAPEVWAAAQYRALLPLPAPADHKNVRGRVLVVAGSRAYPGAAILATYGAQRMGAGYVTLAVPESAVSTAHAHLVSAVVVGMPEDTSHAFASRDVDRVLDIAGEYDAVVLGPGLTVARGAVMLARTLVARLEMPLVIDADALNALVDVTGLLVDRAAPTVITPHPGEAARMLGAATEDVQADRLSAASRLALGKTACVLKGAGTVVAVEGRVVLNTSGSPALATAGTGDVLAGMVGTLLAQGLAPLEAGALAAYVHGRAGEAAAESLTPICVRAEDVAEHVPMAVADLLGGW